MADVEAPRREALPGKIEYYTKYYSKYLKFQRIIVHLAWTSTLEDSTRALSLHSRRWILGTGVLFGSARSVRLGLYANRTRILAYSRHVIIILLKIRSF